MASVIIPCHNEAMNIAQVLRSIRNNYEVIVVDDGSQDNTKDVVISMGHIPVMHRHNKGKSSACITGVRKSRSDVCVFMDGDGQLSAKDIPKITGALCDADIAVGERDYSQIPFARKISNRYAAMCVNYIAGTKFSDVLCGFRGVRKKSFKKISFEKNGYFFESEMIIRASQQGMKIKPVKVDVDYSVGSRMPVHKSMHIAAWLTYLAVKKALTGKHK